jgi:phage-related minor tail protein
MPMTSQEMSEMLTRLVADGVSPKEAMFQIAVAAGVAEPAPDSAVDDYLKDVQARLADPAVLARATELARERGLDLDSLTFGDIDDLVNDATKAIASTDVARAAADKTKPARTKAADPD